MINKLLVYLSLTRDVIDGVGKVIYVTVPLVFTDSFQVIYISSHTQHVHSTCTAHAQHMHTHFQKCPLKSYI